MELTLKNQGNTSFSTSQSQGCSTTQHVWLLALRQYSIRRVTVILQPSQQRVARRITAGLFQASPQWIPPLSAIMKHQHVSASRLPINQPRWHNDMHLCLKIYFLLPSSLPSVLGRICAPTTTTLATFGAGAESSMNAIINT